MSFITIYMVYNANRLSGVLFYHGGIQDEIVM